jgi:uncharacterized membrane protein YdjX (TVP38/TMEM64 family)
MRLAIAALLLALVLLLPFLVLDDRLDMLLGGPELAAWFQTAREWGWLAGLGLLVGDLLLPVPATGVMAALGVAYGPLSGGAISAVGSFLAGALGYGACRLLGSAGLERLLGKADLERARRLAASTGGWLVAGSRALPLLPELVACAAGLVRMPPRRFFPALACGTVPTGFTFAGIGALGGDHPVATLLATTLVPLILWFLVRRRLLGPSGAWHDSLQE